MACCAAWRLVSGTGGVLAQAATKSSAKPVTAMRKRRRERRVTRKFMGILY
jgi:hypothetical protein